MDDLLKMKIIDPVLEKEFPKFVKYLRQQFGERISNGLWRYEQNKTTCPIYLDNEVVGSVECVYSKDGKKLMSKNAAIKAEILPVETDVEMVSLMYYAEEGERKDNYKIPFP